MRKKTLANLTDWPSEKVEALRQVLKGRRLIAPEDAFTVERSRPHGHVEALLTVCRRLGLERLIAAKRCRERDRVLAMVLERLLHPASKLATTRLWHCTTLAEELGVGDDDDLYEAMDCLLERQERIEQRLAKRHLHEGEPVFADVSSSYYEGRTCPLMRFGYNRDRKRGKTQLVYALLSAPGGCPVAVQAYPGNTAEEAAHRRRIGPAQPGFLVIVDEGAAFTDSRGAKSWSCSLPPESAAVSVPTSLPLAPRGRTARPHE